MNSLSVKVNINLISEDSELYWQVRVNGIILSIWLFHDICADYKGVSGCRILIPVIITWYWNILK